jgi:hypothetical protein
MCINIVMISSIAIVSECLERSVQHHGTVVATVAAAAPIAAAEAREADCHMQQCIHVPDY